MIFLLVARPLFSFEVRGAGRIPRSGPAILVARHRSWLDPACMGGAADRPVRFLIMGRIFKKRWANWFYRLMRVIPLAEAGGSSTAALRKALRHLERGGLLGIFPEGRVVSGVEPGELHPGAAMLAQRSKAPVIPLGISGSAEAWPHGSRLPRPARVSVTIGEPVAPEEDLLTDARRAMLQRIELAIGALEAPCRTEGVER